MLAPQRNKKNYGGKDKFLRPLMPKRGSVFCLKETAFRDKTRNWYYPRLLNAS